MKRCRLKFTAIICVTIISMAVIISTTLLAGIGIGEIMGIDISIVSLSAGSITSIIKVHEKEA